MTLKIKSTLQEVHYVNIMVYGEAGVGKTSLARTAPKPIIISAERGLLSLAGVDIPVIDVNNIADVKEAYGYVRGSEYETVIIDSISELGETLLAEAKGVLKDGRAAYMQMGEVMADIVRKFRDIPDKHILFIAKQQRTVDEATGKILYGPMMPGVKFAVNLPYFFDVVGCMRIGKKEKEEYRYIQTQPSLQYEAKDRSGKLAKEEEPNLTKLFQKIKGN